MICPAVRAAGFTVCAFRDEADDEKEGVTLRPFSSVTPNERNKSVPAGLAIA